MNKEPKDEMTKIAELMLNKIETVIDENNDRNAKAAKVDLAVDMLKSILSEKGIDVAFTRWHPGQYQFTCNERRGKIYYDRHEDKYWASDTEAEGLEDMMTKVSGYIAYMHLVNDMYPASDPLITFTM